ncbi:MAG: hypothetical protein ACRDLV_15725, partial [Solirubrobacteraceae bacterium]
MSVLTGPGREPQAFDRRQRATGLGGVAMLAGLSLVLGSPVPTAIAAALACAGAAAAGAVLTGQALRALNRNRALALVGVLGGLAAFWLAAGLRHADAGPPYGPLHGPFKLFPSPVPPAGFIYSAHGWPWEVGRLPLLPLALTILCALGGLVLLADAVHEGGGVEPVVARGREHGYAGGECLLNRLRLAAGV